MAGTIEAWVRRVVAARSPAATRTTRTTGTGATASGTTASGATALGARLVGEAVEIRRLLVVRPDTVAVLVPSGGEPQVRLPGELLVPPLLAPGAPRVTARPFSTRPADLDVTVTDLLTYDGHPVLQAVLRLTVQLDDEDGYAALLELVGSHPDALEERLLAAVHGEVGAAVRGAVRMNRLADLQRLSLAVVLQGRWLPARFGAGTLCCRGLAVQRVRWPGEDEPTVPVPVAAGVALPPPPDPVPAAPR